MRIRMTGRTDEPPTRDVGRIGRKRLQDSGLQSGLQDTCVALTNRKENSSQFLSLRRPQGKAIFASVMLRK